MKRQESTLRRIVRGPAIYLLVVVGALWLFLSFATRQPEARKLSLTAFQSAIREGDVRSATFLERDQKVVGELKDGTRYETTYPEQYQDDLTKELVQAPGPVVDLRTDAQKGSPVVGVLLDRGEELVVGRCRLTAPRADQALGEDRQHDHDQDREGSASEEPPHVSLSVRNSACLKRFRRVRNARISVPGSPGGA